MWRLQKQNNIMLLEYKKIVQATQTHELLVQFFWKADLRMKGKYFFPRDHNACDPGDD